MRARNTRATRAVAVLAALAALAVFATAAAGCTSDPTSAEATSTRPSIPKVTVDVTAVGDSVMLAAADYLREAGMYVDAEVGRQVPAAIDILRNLALRGELGDVVVMHIGHNGEFTAAQFDEIVSLVGPERQLVFLSVRVPSDYEAANNAVIREGAANYANVAVVDWRTMTEERSDLFWEDGLHLNPDGALFYALTLAPMFASPPAAAAGSGGPS